jgi:hypothetical protein
MRSADRNSRRNLKLVPVAHPSMKHHKRFVNWRKIAISLIEHNRCYNPSRGGFNDEPRWCSADVEERA